jgi:hypothetical protein
MRDEFIHFIESQGFVYNGFDMKFRCDCFKLGEYQIGLFSRTYRIELNIQKGVTRLLGLNSISDIGIINSITRDIKLKDLGI